VGVKHKKNAPFFQSMVKRINREIMRIYKDLELVEHLGSGLNRILKVYKKDSFIITQNFMRNRFISNTSPINEGVNEGVNRLLKLIEKSPNRKIPFFAKELETSVKNIERWIKKLKADYKVELKGSPITGGYITK